MNSAVMKKTMYWFVVPALAFYLVFWIVPILKLFQYSVTDYNGFVQSYTYIGFDNFKQLFKDGIAGSSLANTLIYTVVFVIFSNLVSLGLAFLLNMKIRATGFYRTAAYIPTLFSAIVVGFIWSYVYMPESGLLATVLNWFHLNGSDLNLLGSYNSALYAITTVEIWKHIGTSTVIFLAGLQTVPQDMIEAGKMDGASSWQITRLIRLPMLATAITINFTLSIINGLKAFDYPFIMTNGGPGRATTTLLVDIFNIAFKEQQFGKASALAVISFAVIIMITTYFVLKLNKREVSA
ncbi:carbohydrate ABC transporter permease [Paenibacillus whitsoniae]|uniref:Sugar ABC transporter permease n=1 Tax=Paenibacillus whitsoniae TaxID=2496558 RepID=A0A3S0CYG9_9BACL|nr:sugar ABC transporter permease [Paenibacillus whitsoniae]RTE11687.1 sugar ABC transporter permease [Paenibacillus whitsoniae]